MPHFELRAEDRVIHEKVEDIIRHTKVLKRQLDLEVGRWSFVVFGPHDDGHTIVREGCALHLRIESGLVYVAAMGDPEVLGVGGMPIEEFAQGDIPPELKGLEIYHIDPVRPLTIFDKRKGPPASEAAETILDEYQDKNIAVIETPHEQYWSVSVLKYLRECDQFFPDALTEALKKGTLPLKGYIPMDPAKVH